MVFNQISQPRQRVSLRGAFSELALSGFKTSGCTTSPHLRFSNHGRSGGSQTISALLAIGCGSVTMTDRAVLKQHPRWQEPLDRFSNHGRSSGSQTDVAHEGGPRKFSNRGRSGDSQTLVAASLTHPSFSNRGRSSGSQTYFDVLDYYHMVQ